MTQTCFGIVEGKMEACRLGESDGGTMAITNVVIVMTFESVSASGAGKDFHG